MYFERFKMDLHSKSDLTRNTMCTATNGKTMSLITVLSHVIRYFKEQAIKQFNSGNTKDVSPDDIKWVITVPAIWKDGAKQMMREAALKADLSSEKVIIALEPEAAAVYCKSVDIISPCVDEKEDTTEAFTSGTRYLLADMGGGTVDVTVHEVGKDKKVRELHHATGGAWGGTYVDKNFVLLLKRIFGKDLIESFQADYPCDWSDLVSVKFERAKRTASVGGPVRVELPYEFCSFLERKGCSVAQHVTNFCNDEIKFSRGALTLNYPEVAKIYDPVFKNITAHLKSILEKVDGIKYVVLVGGFATSLLLQEDIKRKLASLYRLRVITVYNCSLAVVMGSVLFGHDSTLIASRRVKYSYGISCYLPFVADVDPDSSLFVSDDGEELCKNRFNVFAEINEEIAVGQERVHSLYPVRAHNTEMTLPVYLSSNPKSRYTTEEDVEKVAYMILPMPNTEKGTDRRVNVAMRFGETEIQIISEDTSSGEKIERWVRLDFLDSHN